MPRVPLLVDLTGWRVVVVGGGTAGAAKARRLVAAGADVVVVDPAGPVVDGAVTVARPFLPGDLAGARLVVTATGRPEVDDAVAAAAEAVGALVNRADRPDGGPVAMAATLDRGPVQVAVSTGGASPALAAWVRDRIAAVLPVEVGRLAELLDGRPRRSGPLFDAALAALVGGDDGGARRLLEVGP